MRRLPVPLIILGLLAYIGSPIDILPDILGPLGRIDDLVIAGIVAYNILKRSRTAAGSSTNQTATNTPGSHTKRSKTPWEVFNLAPTATRDEIEARYKELCKQYHPDRVATLGEELQTLAHEKTIEIQAAYESLVAASARP